MALQSLFIRGWKQLSAYNTSRRKQNKNRWSLQIVDTLGKQRHR